jgi:hypothetical protein
MGLQHLEECSFDQVLSWLERALRGREALLKVIPDESPEDPILRQARSLSGPKRKDLEVACQTLIRRYVRGPESDDDYALALLRLAKGLGLSTVVVDLHQLAEAEAFAELSAAQAKGVLHTLLDLRAQLPVAFWQNIARSPLPFAGITAVSALLEREPKAAFDLVCALPDDELAADSLFIVLDQHARRLNDAETEEMAHLVKMAQGRAKQPIREALDDWLKEHGEAQNAEESGADVSNHEALGSALHEFWMENDGSYDPQPISAKLVPSNHLASAA